MGYKLRRFKKTDECDGGCVTPPVEPSEGMGPVIPMVSGDRFDNILGVGFANNVPYPKVKRYKVKKKNRKK